MKLGVDTHLHGRLYVPVIFIPDNVQIHRIEPVTVPAAATANGGITASSISIE